ncbi:hypothetical protein KKE34_04275 [Patescibacteria group bacterium]|nr:hypothetical protein [Patescibacteria group bacterium]MBU1885796.1 hypothetical protein [Patescibacteria group bacterium]
MKKILPDILVYYVESSDGVKGASKAFDKLELPLDSLKGRKFYGLIYGNPPNDKYIAYMKVSPGDNFDFLSMTIPGGEYAQEKIKDWGNNLSQVPGVFRKLADSNQVDTSRPSIEHYSSMRELRCLVPIK